VSRRSTHHSDADVGGARDSERDSGARPRRDRRSSRWDEHRRARRHELTAATIVAIRAHGAEVGMSQVAAQARTSKTVVYRHFADRTELHVAVSGRVAEQLLAKLRQAMESSDQPREMVAAAITAYLAFLEADPELYRFVVQRSPDRAAPSPTRPDPIDHLSHLVGEQAAALMAVALDRAGQDTAAAGPWGHGLVGLVRSAADWWLRGERPMLRSELAAHLTDLAWAGLSRVAAPAPPSKEEP
jgi:AcrR family transcriptional regulator